MEASMILVAGATGVLGSEIVQRLRSRGEAVRALVRPTSSAEKVERLRAMGADIACGDVRDRASLDDACRGVSAVISTVTMITTAQPGDSFADTDEAGTRNLVDAAAAAGVDRFVYISFDHQRTPDCPLSRAKRETEAHLLGSGMTYTVLRPGLFMESWLGPMLFADVDAAIAKVYGSGTHPLRYVAVADVAEVAVQSLTSAAARNAVITFAGPEAVSQRDAVRLVEQAFGKPFTVSEIPEAALEAQWSGATDPFQRTFSSLMLGVARGLGASAPPLPSDYVLRMTTVRDYVSRVAEQHGAERRPSLSLGDDRNAGARAEA
jgi:uncharacterized protein YbjT (DUF2867 family)